MRKKESLPSHFPDNMMKYNEDLVEVRVEVLNSNNKLDS